MNASRLRASVCVLVVALLAGNASADTFGTGDNQFTLDFVTISGATNPTSGYGIVNNDYRMGTYEITNDHWNKFRSSVGASVTGSPSSAYDLNPEWVGNNVPTNNVSWYEAAQFVNWLNTSTGHQMAYTFTGTQGTASYALATWSTAEADNGTNLYRHKDAMYYLPTEDQWVKAAYWNGTAIQTYANVSASDLVFGLPNPAKWNYQRSLQGQPWAVGSGAQELNGTYDMMGNVTEWMENPWSSGNYGTGSNRGLHGGSYNDEDFGLASSFRYSSTNGSPSFEGHATGFRVASEVPEPASLTLLALGGLVLRRARRQ